ncbi:PDZ domain-containing protein [bacterium]|nr:PDZ domain-containing protein [bacterium]
MGKNNLKCERENMAPWIVLNLILIVSTVGWLAVNYQKTSFFQPRTNSKPIAREANPSHSAGMERKTQIRVTRPEAPLPNSLPAAQVAMVTPPPNSQDIGRAWLGIDVLTVDTFIANELKLPFKGGVLVNHVFPKSPAGKRCLIPGDVICGVNNKPVNDEISLWTSLTGMEAGEEVTFMVFRKGEYFNIALTLEPEPANVRAFLSRVPKGPPNEAIGIEPPEELTWLGIDVQSTADLEVAREFGISPDLRGVLITNVEGAAAIDAGLKTGDLIKRINNREIFDIQSFNEVAKTVDLSKEVLIDLVRRNKTIFTTLFADAQNPEPL